MISLLPAIAISIAISFCVSKIVINRFSKQLLDIPNTRSSHSTPTPRGGGIAIVVATLLATLLNILINDQAQSTTLLLLVPGCVIAAIGLVDDLLSLDIRSRLFAQLVIAIAFTFATLHGSGLPKVLLLVLGVLAVLGMVWLINLYNFMDGINGLAGLQCVFVCSGMTLIFFLDGRFADLQQLMLVISAATLGFLYWNFPKAKLFMGDTGSLFIGATLACLMLWTGHKSISLTIIWLILLASFIADASYTLLARILSGQKFYLPHRTHFYQKLASHFGSHTKATTLIMAFNVAWLLPIATSVSQGQLNPLIGLLLAYGPALYCTYRLRAGLA